MDLAVGANACERVIGLHVLGPLLFAAKYGDAAACLSLLDDGEDAEGGGGRLTPEAANATTPDGKTALHWAASFGHAGVCAALLDRAPGLFTADCVNAKDKQGGMTALHYAASSGLAGVCMALLDRAPGLFTADSVNATDGYGKTALDYARSTKDMWGDEITDGAKLAGRAACARALEAHPSCGGDPDAAEAAEAEEEDGGGEK